MTLDPVPVGSAWESYDAAELYLVVADRGHGLRVLVLAGRSDLEGRVTVASRDYLRAGKRIA